jgi:hypothetical protein
MLYVRAAALFASNLGDINASHRSRCRIDHRGCWSSRVHGGDRGATVVDASPTSRAIDWQVVAVERAMPQYHFRRSITPFAQIQVCYRGLALTSCQHLSQHRTVSLNVFTCSHSNWGMD